MEVILFSFNVCCAKQERYKSKEEIRTKGGGKRERKREREREREREERVNSIIFTMLFISYLRHSDRQRKK